MTLWHSGRQTGSSLCKMAEKHGSVSIHLNMVEFKLSQSRELLQCFKENYELQIRGVTEDEK